MKTKFVLMLLIAISLFGCNKENEKEVDNLPQLIVVDVSQESDWDYWVVGDNGDYYFIKESNQKPELVFYHSANGDEFTVKLINGMPVRVISDNWIFLFANFQNNYVDVGIINPSGEYEVLKNIETSFNWDEIALKNANTTQEWSDIIRWAGRVVGAIPCALSVAATVGTVGASIALPLITCTNYILGLSADIMENEFDIQNGYTETISTYSGMMKLLNCVSLDPSSCCLSIASLAYSQAADDVEKMEKNRDLINNVAQSLYIKNTAYIVLYLPFNGSGNDISANNYHGIVHGATLIEDRFGISNNAYSFDGEDDFIEITNSQNFNITQHITISFWAVFKSDAPYYFPYHILEKFGCWSLGQRGNDVNFIVTTDTGEHNVWALDLEFNKWTHIVMRYDGTSVKIFVNGKENASEAASGTLKTNSNKLYISKYTNGGNYYFDGILDDFVVFQRALSDEEIRNL